MVLTPSGIDGIPLATLGPFASCYAETKQRVPVEITPDLVARTMEIVGQARTAARLAPPPPLRSSPKCPRCSLAGICLPDEVNVLAARQGGQPRRLVAADPDAVPLYVTEQGSVVGIDGGRLTVSKYLSCWPACG